MFENLEDRHAFVEANYGFYRDSYFDYFGGIN